MIYSCMSWFTTTTTTTTDILFFLLRCQVWRVDGQQKTLLSASDQSKFYSGDCYIFQYSYPGEERDEHLIGTWIGKHSVEVKPSDISYCSCIVPWKNISLIIATYYIKKLSTFEVWFFRVRIPRR